MGSSGEIARSFSRTIAPRLRRIEAGAPADALLVETDRASALFDVLTLLGGESRIPAYRVAGGVLIRLPAGRDARLDATLAAKGTRLRSLAPRFFLPVDADIVPALLDDEAAGLTRDRGLVLLPDGRALAFDPKSPLGLAELCRVRRGPLRDWKPAAEPPRFADRLELITRIVPLGDGGGMGEGFASDPDGGDPLEELGDEIGTESPRPPECTPGQTILGRATYHAGQGMHSLGKWLGIEKLTDLGASMMGKAMSIAPRLSEAILGKQEGAIRELLRMFQEGRIEDALRHALPVGGNFGRGSGISGDAELPVNDTKYSLKSLMGDGGPRGPSALWIGGLDLQEALFREYHRAAAEALVRGDIRRAAFIHARLLNDHRTAAEILDKGGLHHDAAWIYLNKLNDPLRAAQAFETAGEIGRALSIYVQREEHALAGDLLRRSGDPEAALPHYRRAAEVWAARPGASGALDAGDLIRDRAGRPDLAMPYYVLGWSRRPDPASLNCALRLANRLGDLADADGLLALIGEADLEFQGVGRDDEAARFYHNVAQLAERPALAAARDDLRDRALLGLAAKLRQGVAVRPNDAGLVSTLLGQANAWSPEVLSDAQAAVHEAATQERNRRSARGARPASVEASSKPFATLDIQTDRRVTAVAATLMGELFVGFEDGSLARVFRGGQCDWLCRIGPSSYAEERCVGIPSDPIRFQPRDPRGHVRSIAVDPGGHGVAALWSGGFLHTFSRESEGTMPFDGDPGATWFLPAFTPHTFSGGGSAWMTPYLPAREGVRLRIALFDGERIQFDTGSPSLGIRFTAVPIDFCKETPRAGLLLDRPSTSKGTIPLILTHDGPDWCLIDLEGKSPRRRYLGWEPGTPKDLLAVPSLSSLPVEPGVVELAGVTDDGGLRWSSLTIGERDFILSGKAGADDTVYTSARLIRPGVVIATTEAEVRQFHCDARRMRLLASLPLPAGASVVGIAAGGRADLLQLVTSDGRLLSGRMPA